MHLVWLLRKIRHFPTIPGKIETEILLIRCCMIDYFQVNMLNAVTANFLGDNLQCWMQIQSGKGPWSSEVSGIVKIGQTMTMVLGIKDEENKFDMVVSQWYKKCEMWPKNLIERSFDIDIENRYGTRLFLASIVHREDTTEYCFFRCEIVWLTMENVRRFN